MQDMLIAISLLVVGFVLLAVEAFIIPGFGIAGIGGLLLVGGGCVLAWAAQGWAAGLAAIAVSFAVTLVGVWLIARSRAAKKMVLEGFNPGESARTDGMRALVGKTGVTTSDLHPSGTAEIDGERFQVTSGNEWVEAGERVRVTRIGTFSLFVERVEREDEEGPGETPTTT